MTPPAPLDITFITPSHLGDLDRFTFQRESYERQEIRIPHVAIVDHEDLAEFARIPFQKNLTLISTRDVLPRFVEARRNAIGYPRRDPRHWVNPPPLHGWIAQQIMKFAAPTVVSTPGIVTLDSDAFFVGPVGAEDFQDAEGRLHFYEVKPDLNAELADWYISSLKFLGVPLKGQVLRQHVHPIVPLHRDVVLELRRYIERRHSTHWARAMIRHGMTEYMTYGAFARHVYGLKGLVPVEQRLCLGYWAPGDMEHFERDLTKRLEETGARMVQVQSNIGLPVSAYRGAVEKVWKLG